MEQSRPEPSGQVGCAIDGRAREVELPKSFGAQNIMGSRSLTLSFILLDFGFPLI